jgi:hypothetical protein
LTVQNQQSSMKNLHYARPSGFEEYTVAVNDTNDTIFIVKPGVTLD